MQDRDTLHQKSGKANFEVIYDLEDPREYFNVLGRFDYCIPQHGHNVFSKLIEARRYTEEGSASRSRVVDVCCSYGINAALVKHELTLDDLYERYGSPELSDLSSDELAEADSVFYKERRRWGTPEVVGVDVARNAVSYGVRSGLLDAGFAENLEENEPSEELGRAVRGANLLTVTGGVGYISGHTIERLLEQMSEGQERVPWVAAFALRWVSYEEISEVLSEHGMVTEKLEGHTFTQRRFTDAEEREYVLEELEGMGVETAGKEEDGWYHANFYLSRPAWEANVPVEKLLAPVL
jgi:hypothetical protein